MNTLIFILLPEFRECSFELFVFRKLRIHGFFRNFPGKLRGPVVRKPVSPNPGLKVNRNVNFSSIKIFFTAYDLRGSSLIKLKAEGQKEETENLIKKLQYSKQNSRTTWPGIFGRMERSHSNYTKLR